ncbi:GNAT family N-acetyltransferase [Streptomyces pinistramenti]|uniref:GNAT family N-acetyltransferase n=1 Tax=Streptomyces pinistramenti TaxID=2884812 RepID=UPI001D05C655|nr:GNAT family N-acetyltransferase [Streptomyces pinistramenti]MCB5906739.1 GNAT family N-acetyltransferase [Streptomyces pinistramenti]
MPQLIAPTVRVQASFLQAMAEFRAEGRGEEGDGSAVAREIRAYADRWHDPAVFAEYAAWLRSMTEEKTAVALGYVPCDNLWYVEGDTYLGRLGLRHRLNDFLCEYGGHIGYDVRPTARRRGHATAMLRAALPWARTRGLDQVLVTCDAANEPSRKVIEACGGAFDDRRGAKLRYWVPTGAPAERPRR